MSKRTLSLRLIFACCTAFLAFLFLEQPYLYGKVESIGEGRADGIVIDLPAIPGGDQMPGVKFYHDLHTEQSQAKQSQAKQSKGKENNCSVCHLKAKEKDNFVFKYKRIKDSDTKTDMAVYHENCIACHTDVKAEGKRSGPLEAQCRDCHNTRKKDISAWNPISFDKSLHNRHETAKAIISPMGQDEPNCTACHHGYDEKADKLFYNKGEEESCRYCHKSSEGTGQLSGKSSGIYNGKYAERAGKKTITLEKASSMRDASHNACVNCHLVEMKNFAGPVNCNGCHDLAAQKKIEKLQDVPRLKRNQPDVVMIFGWDAAKMSAEETPGKELVKEETGNEEIAKEKAAKEKTAKEKIAKEKIAQKEIVKVVEQYMNPVVFNHENHEKASKNCRSCHHDTLKSCKECHTVQGSEEGGFVKLEKAMHDTLSNQSCIGCHNRYKTSPDCAGCHAQMPQKTFAESDNSCNTCHSVDIKAMDMDFPAIDKAAMNIVAEKMLLEKMDDYKTVADEKIPDKITIGYLVDKYEASEFPHAKVIKAIKKRIAKSSMAKAFHTDAATLCMGCHHNSPATEKPQKCGSCHGKNDMMKGNDGRPGLKGAYHGQCITCHQKMNIETVAATDCNKCHREKK